MATTLYSSMAIDSSINNTGKSYTWTKECWVELGFNVPLDTL